MGLDQGIQGTLYFSKRGNIYITQLTHGEGVSVIPCNQGLLLDRAMSKLQFVWKWGTVPQNQVVKHHVGFKHCLLMPLVLSLVLSAFSKRPTSFRSSQRQVELEVVALEGPRLRGTGDAGKQWTKHGPKGWP